MRPAAQGEVALIGTIEVPLGRAFIMSDPSGIYPHTPPKRRFLDRKSSTPTLVGVGTHLQGELQCAGDLSVAGEVLGTGQIQGMLTLSETGHWQGAAHCTHALVAGRLEGQLVVNGKLEIRSTAHIHGEITAQQIAIAEGAVIEASITVLSGAPIQRFEEKRTPA